ncbi:MAG: radical SAM protein [Candidatus Omnitrophota bacterium]
MKSSFTVMISYPPLSGEGTALLSQNRQFQWFKSPTFIYPVVPASAATLLKEHGFDVIWNDCGAEGLDHEAFLKIIQEKKPDVIAFETKTPVVKQHWKIINEIKALGNAPSGPLTVLYGDHVTALPEESFKNSAVDYVLTGGDYDFLLLSLCKALRLMRSPDTRHQSPEKNLSTVDYRPSTQFEPGIYFRENGQVRNTGKFELNHDLNSLPTIDRDLTRWELYAYKNGNFKRTPGTYIMSGRDCWWGKCTFCSWPTLYPRFRFRRYTNVLDEIGSLIERYKVREIMDDAGTLAIDDWLKGLCLGMVERGYQKKIYLDCNMRFGHLKAEDYRLMKKANFRLLLFGVESANQATLDRLNKNLKVDDVITGCKAARAAGLYPHITIMFGYPWETYEDAQRTLKLGSYLLRKGYAYTVQATVVIPYPGTPLFDECRSQGLLLSEDWDRYGMKEPVMKTGMAPEELLALVRSIYRIGLHPELIVNRLAGVRDLDDLKYFGRAGKKVIGHILDFKKKP